MEDLLLIRDALSCSQGDSAGDLLFIAAVSALEDKWWGVAGIGIFEGEGLSVQNPEEQGDEHARCGIRGNHIIGISENFCGQGLLGGTGPYDHPGQSHEQGGRYALSGHVCNYQSMMAMGKGDKVVKVASHLHSRDGHCRYLEIGYIRRGFGNKASLYLRGDMKLRPVPLQLLLHDPPLSHVPNRLYRPHGISDLVAEGSGLGQKI